MKQFDNLISIELSIEEPLNDVSASEQNDANAVSK